MTSPNVSVADAVAALDEKYYRYDGTTKLRETSALLAMAQLTTAAGVSAGMQVPEI